MKWADRVETTLVRAALAFVRMLPPVRASDLGGAVARTVGPLLPVSRVGHANLRRALPALGEAERRRVVRGVWDNLGRNVAELPHLKTLRRTAHGPGWEIDGEAVLERARAEGGPVVLVSGHIGNWEVLPVIAAQLGTPIGSFYRAASNAGVDRIIQEVRAEAAGTTMPMFTKGAAGAKAALAHLAGGGWLGTVADQKMNEGVAVPFFGRMAMTASAAASLAVRFRCPMIVVFAERLGPMRFRLRVRAPLVQPEGDRAAAAAAMTAAMMREFETFIRAHPESWLWLHRRWPKETPDPQDA